MMKPYNNLKIKLALKKNAIKNTVQLANMGNQAEEITWSVEEE